MNNIAHRVERFLVKELLSKSGITDIHPDESLISSGILDSLALLQLISFLEDEFGVVIEDVEVIPDNLQTLNTITALVSQKL